MNNNDTNESNLFDFLKRGIGSENAFSAGFAYLLASEPEAQRVFLTFVEEQTGVAVEHKDGWKVETEVKREALGGTSFYVDLMLSRPDPMPTELWFEHKIESPLGKGQLDKYLEAMTRFEAGGGKVVQLAFISRGRIDLSGAAGSKLRDPGESGVRWCAAEGGSRGFMSWSDLLKATQAAESAWADTNRMFVDWWARLRFMVEPAAATSWSSVIPKLQADNKFERTRLEKMWYLEAQRAEQMGWAKDGSAYVGNDHGYKRGDLRLHVIAFDSHEMASKKSGINLSGMRAELLEVSLVGGGLKDVGEKRRQDDGAGCRGWSLKTTHANANTWVRVVIEVGELGHVDFSDDQQVAEILADTFCAAVDVLRSEFPQHFSPAS